MSEGVREGGRETETKRHRDKGRDREIKAKRERDREGEREGERERERERERAYQSTHLIARVNLRRIAVFRVLNAALPTRGSTAFAIRSAIRWDLNCHIRVSECVASVRACE